MTDIRTTRTALEVLTTEATSVDVRVTRTALEVLTTEAEVVVDIRVTRIALEVLASEAVGGVASLRRVTFSINYI